AGAHPGGEVARRLGRIVAAEANGEPLAVANVRDRIPEHALRELPSRRLHLPEVDWLRRAAIGGVLHRGVGDRRQLGPDDLELGRPGADQPGEVRLSTLIHQVLGDPRAETFTQFECLERVAAAGLLAEDLGYEPALLKGRVVADQRFSQLARDLVAVEVPGPTRVDELVADPRSCVEPAPHAVVRSARALQGSGECT